VFLAQVPGDQRADRIAHRKRQARTKAKAGKKVCPCGRAFKPKGRGQGQRVYCKPACGDRHRRRRMRERDLEGKVRSYRRKLEQAERALARLRA